MKAEAPDQVRARTDTVIADLQAEVTRLIRLAAAWREILDAVDHEARRVAICRTCVSNECQIREVCTSSTACRSLYALATQSSPALQPQPLTEGTAMTATASFRPLHDRILVKRVDADAKTPSGLFIPENAKEKPVEALVIAVGEGTRDKDGTRIPLDVKAGDRVLFSKYSGTEVKISLDGGDHLIMREDDVLAVIG